MNRIPKILLTTILAAILLLGFAVPVNMVGNWYQQFMPSLNGMPISDITFIDSLNGFAVTGDQTPNDTNYILKTTTGGDNWTIVYRGYRNYFRVKFVNSNTGFVCGGFNISTGELLKTTNSGNNWITLNTPGATWYDDMSVLDENTIWLVEHSSLDGGVYYTSTGGASWTQQFSGGTQNPNKIYMYNARIGFMSNSSALPNIYKTTNGGTNWNVLVNNDRFNRIFFADSLTGWRTRGDTMKYTSDGGLSWTKQLMPFGGIIFNSNIKNFYNINRDTIWGVGGFVSYPNSQVRGILYRTTNGGVNWQFQVPDTSFVISYSHIFFTDKFHGWVYDTGPFGTAAGIHTITGGDPIWITEVRQVSTEVPRDYKLFQNYPNPFNASSRIKFEMSKAGYAELKVFDMTGRTINILVNQKLNAGIYETDFNGNKMSSGVYFYRIEAEDFVETKKMVLLK